jgi:hypothetical protein
VGPQQRKKTCQRKKNSRKTTLIKTIRLPIQLTKILDATEGKFIKLTKSYSIPNQRASLMNSGLLSFAQTKTKTLQARLPKGISQTPSPSKPLLSQHNIQEGSFPASINVSHKSKATSQSTEKKNVPHSP